jgi:hypothetical protein
MSERDVSRDLRQTIGKKKPDQRMTLAGTTQSYLFLIDNTR